jgi:hypothetical protein
MNRLRLCDHLPRVWLPSRLHEVWFHSAPQGRRGLCLLNGDRKVVLSHPRRKRRVLGGAHSFLFSPSFPNLECEEGDADGEGADDQADGVGESEGYWVFVEFAARGEEPDTIEPEDHERHDHP